MKSLLSKERYGEEGWKKVNRSIPIENFENGKARRETLLATR